METFFRPHLGYISRPTPFVELANLRRSIGAKPRIFMKRDDLTEMGNGGNKTRKLDFVMYDAREIGANAVVTWGGPQSNHVRQTIAYAVKLGMESHIVINGEMTDDPQGNLFLFGIMGATLYYETDETKCPARCEEIAAQLTEAGKKPYFVPLGASNPLGTIGYIESMKEIAEQSAALDIAIGAVFVATGSAGTQAGLEIGQRLYLPHAKVNGVAVSRETAKQQANVGALIKDTIEYLNLDMSVEASDIIVHDKYYGERYGIPTQAGNEAIKLVGKTEGIILDPVYTGKAMSGMIDLLQTGSLDEYEAVVFVHTGGSPAIFNYTKSF